MNVNYRIQLKFMLFPFLPESPPKKKIKIPSYFLTEIIYAVTTQVSKYAAVQSVIFQDVLEFGSKTAKIIRSVFDLVLIFKPL